MLDDPNRAVLRALLKRPDAIDVLVPRGSPSLIDFCRTASGIPVLASGGGVNHLYAHHSADLVAAVSIALDSKVPAPAGCTSLEVALVDAEVSEAFVDRPDRPGGQRTAAPRYPSRREFPLAARADDGGPCRVDRLGPHDLGREFLDSTIGVVAVSGLTEAVEHIGRYGSGHTEGIVAAEPEAAEEFCRLVDASVLVVNGSLRLNDGPTLGLGSEIAISTSRLHARGPITLAPR